MDVEPGPHNVAIARLAVGDFGIEVYLRVDLETLELCAVVDCRLALPFFLLLPVMQGQGGLCEIDVCVVGTSMNPRIPCSLALFGIIHHGPPAALRRYCPARNPVGPARNAINLAYG